MISGILNINSLTKKYNDEKYAVKDLNFKVNKGEIFGLLGPNGAGKTTTIKMLTGLLEPTEGVINILGIDPLEDSLSLRNKIGVVTEHSQMYNELSGLDNLLYYGALFGYKEKDIKGKCLILLERVALTNAKDKLLSTYSTGMRQRLSLARALLHDPEVLFLDEPTSGLDPEGAEVIHTLLKVLSKEEGRTIILCTHQLQYAEGICDNFGFMSNGELKAVGTLNELQKKYIPEIRVDIDTCNGIYTLNVMDKTDIAAKVKDLVSDGYSVYSVIPKKPTLEDLYFKVIPPESEALK